MTYFPTSFLFPGHAEGSVTVLLFPATAWICPLSCVSTDFTMETHSACRGLSQVLPHKHKTGPSLTEILMCLKLRLSSSTLWDGSLALKHTRIYFLHSPMTSGTWALPQMTSQPPAWSGCPCGRSPRLGQGSCGQGAWAHTHPFGTFLVPQPCQHWLLWAANSVSTAWW